MISGNLTLLGCADSLKAEDRVKFQSFYPVIENILVQHGAIIPPADPTVQNKIFTESKKFTVGNKQHSGGVEPTGENCFLPEKMKKKNNDNCFTGDFLKTV